MTTASVEAIPVVPRLERLPLESLGWDGFEAFCRDLISRLPGVRGCFHYGKQGDTQLGLHSAMIRDRADVVLWLDDADACYVNQPILGLLRSGMWG